MACAIATRLTNGSTPSLHAEYVEHTMLQRGMPIQVLDALIGVPQTGMCLRIDPLGIEVQFASGSKVFITNDDLVRSCKTTDGCNVRTPFLKMPKTVSDVSGLDNISLPPFWVPRYIGRETGQKEDALYIGYVNGKECFARTKRNAFRLASGETVLDKNIPGYKKRWIRQHQITG